MLYTKRSVSVHLMATQVSRQIRVSSCQLSSCCQYADARWAASLGRKSALLCDQVRRVHCEHIQVCLEHMWPHWVSARSQSGSYRQKSINCPLIYRLLSPRTTMCEGALSDDNACHLSVCRQSRIYTIHYTTIQYNMFFDKTNSISLLVLVHDSVYKIHWKPPNQSTW